MSSTLLDVESTLDMDAPDFFGTTVTESSTDESTNPFYLSAERSVSHMKYHEVAERFERTLVLCTSDNSGDFDPVHVADFKLSDEYLESARQHLVLVPGSIRMMQVPTHRANTVVVSRDNLTGFNKNRLALAVDELVLLLPTPPRESAAKLYTDLFSSDLTNVKVAQMVLLANTFDVSWMDTVKSFLSSVKYQNPEVKFWEEQRLMSMTDPFTDRRFQYSESVNGRLGTYVGSNNKHPVDQRTAELIKTLQTLKPDDTNYLSHLPGKKTFTDGATVVKGQTGRQKYHISSLPTSLNMSQVTEMFNLVTESRIRYDMFNMLALSKDMSHLVMNNASVLKMMAPLFKQYRPVYQYLLGYPMLGFYFEECIKKTHSNPNDRHIFDLDTASRLPWFPHSQRLKSPYVPLLVSERVVDAEHNLLGLRTLADYEDYGIADQTTFNRRLNMFTSGNPSTNIFEGLDMAEAGLAFTGSVIPVCSQKRNPLSLLTDTPGSSDDDMFRRYMTEYYDTSDMDVMCDKTNVFDFMDSVNKLVNVVNTNLRKIESTASDVAVEISKGVSMTVSVEYIESVLCKEMECDKDYVLRHLDSPEIRERLYQLYVANKGHQNTSLRTLLRKNGRTNPLYERFFKMEPMESMTITIVTEPIAKSSVESADNEMYTYSQDNERLMYKISENPKFKISSPHLKHNLEIFSVRFGFVACVSRFHFPCVRGFYDGTKTRLLPSAVCALMSMFNVDNKYFAGVRDPIEIANKYVQRGFSCAFNQHERNHMVHYNADAPNWKEIFKINTKSNASIDAHLRPRQLSDTLFKASHHRNGVPEDAYNDVSGYRYITTDEDLRQWYAAHGYDESKSSVRFLSFSTIDSEGYPTQFQPWVLDAGWSALTPSE